KTHLQIDPILRVHNRKLISCFEKRDYLGIEDYLGDEDIIGYGIFSVPFDDNLKGVYKLDRYDYVLSFK
ncbi:MAG: hypothetical protein AAF391_01875, partial [Bacteroidota bacterium]